MRLAHPAPQGGLAEGAEGMGDKPAIPMLEQGGGMVRPENVHLAETEGRIAHCIDGTSDPQCQEEKASVSEEKPRHLESARSEKVMPLPRPLNDRAVVLPGYEVL